MSTAVVRSGEIVAEGPLPYAAKVAALNAFQNRQVTVTCNGTTIAIKASPHGQLTLINVTQPDLFSTQPATNPPWVTRLRNHINNHRKAKQ